MTTGKSRSKNKGDKKQNAITTGQSHASDLEDLQHEELSGIPDKKPSTATRTDDDEGEAEGLGDGNIGRSKKDILNKE